MNSGQPMRSALASMILKNIDRVQQGSHLRQGDLRPDHVLAGAPANPVLGADPQAAIRGGRVDQQDIDCLLGTRESAASSPAHDLVGVRKIGHAQRGDASRTFVFVAGVFNRSII